MSDALHLDTARVGQGLGRRQDAPPGVPEPVSPAQVQVTGEHMSFALERVEQRLKVSKNRRAHTRFFLSWAEPSNGLKKNQPTAEPEAKRGRRIPL